MVCQICVSYDQDIDSTYDNISADWIPELVSEV